ncbi:MAG TPA: GWxTD domain-containing protein, partial [Gemmatimonadales bacterium]|nr:GWxTD domain-containing protein [Gemmatimonadales bacterium]
ELTSVLGILARTRASAHAAKKDAVVHTELGWALLRAGQVFQSKDTLYAAADEFYHAVELERRWAYPWYGLGMADIALELAHARVRATVHQPAGAAWIQTAGIAFTNALKEDPTYRPAAVALAKATLENNFDPQSTDAVALLAPLLDTLNGEPEPFLMLGRLDRRLDSLPNALAAFNHYLTRGGDSGVGMLEQARTLFGLDRTAAAESVYYSGASVARSAEALAQYRQDISYVADSAELQAFEETAPSRRLQTASLYRENVTFDSTTAPSLRSWLEEFWRKRDVASGQPTGHRLAEHYRRWMYALQHYPNWARINQYAFENVYRNGPAPFDDRGAVYIRQGPPDQVATSAYGTVPNESWMYFRPGGNIVLHFAAGGLSGWKLISSLASIAPWDHPDLVAEFFSSRVDFGPVYMQLAMQAELDAGRAQMRAMLGKIGQSTDKGALSDNVINATILDKERLASTSAIQRATTTDADPIRYAHSLDEIIQVYGASSPDPGQARLLVEYALPDLRGIPTRTLPDSSVVYALRLRVQAADSAGHLALNTDSVRLIHAHRPLAKGQTLIGFALLDVPPAEYRVKVMISDTTDSTGAVWAIAGIPAPALDGPTLTLSDPILGREGSGLSWVRPDGTIPLNPLNDYSKGSSAVLSYEVGGLAPGASYTTRIAVRKFGADSAHNAISISFPSVAANSRELISKELGLGNLDRGRYLLILTVSDGTHAVERTRRIVVGR